MGERIQKQPERSERPDDTAADVGSTAISGAVGDKSGALKAEIDDLLDEIDGVLEVNAEQFVKDYVQKGGE